MAREKGMGNLQQEKSGRWTIRVGIGGKRYCRSARTKDRAQAERFLQRFLAPLGLGERRLPLADVWREYVKSPLRNELAATTLNAKRLVWMHFARWMEDNYLPVKDLGAVTADMVAEYLACLRVDLCGSTYNNRVCVLREIFRVLAAKAGLEDDPWAGVRLRPDDCHSRRELTMDELRRLLAAAKKAEAEGGGGEWSCLFLIGIYTGLRLGDCCRLDWSSINLAQGIIQLVPRKTRRHAHGRPITIPIHPALVQALLASKLESRVGVGEGRELESRVGVGEGRELESRVGVGERRELEFRVGVGEGRELESRVGVGERNLMTCAAEPLSGGHGVTRPTMLQKDENHHSPTPTQNSNSIPDHDSPTPTQNSNSIPDHHSPTPTQNSNFSLGPVLPVISEMYDHSRTAVSTGLSRIFQAAKITTSIKLEGRRRKTPEATFHSLRHTFVSFAANAGVPLHIVQSIVGHESTAMTRHYYHENLTALKTAVNAIPNI